MKSVSQRNLHDKGLNRVYGNDAPLERVNCQAKTALAALVAAAIMGIALAIFGGLFFGHVGSPGFITSIAAGGLITLASIVGIVCIAKKNLHYGNSLQQKLGTENRDEKTSNDLSIDEKAIEEMKKSFCNMCNHIIDDMKSQQKMTDNEAEIFKEHTEFVASGFIGTVLHDILNYEVQSDIISKELVTAFFISCWSYKIKINIDEKATEEKKKNFCDMSNHVIDDMRSQQKMTEAQAEIFKEAIQFAARWTTNNPRDFIMKSKYRLAIKLNIEGDAKIISQDLIKEFLRLLFKDEFEKN